MFLNNKRIGVMLGGSSCEREISLKSGKAVACALKTRGLDIVLLEICRETEEEVKDLVQKNRVDVVFIAMHGGFGEDGRLQHILDEFKVPYTGSARQASGIAMDKYVSRRLFEKAGLPVPKYKKFNKNDADFALNGLQYPLVVKPSSQGSSIGISFVEAVAHFEKAVKDAFVFDDDILVEEFIKGRELTVAILDGEPLPVVEIIPKSGFFDFQSKYGQGFTDYVVPASLLPGIAEKIQSNAVRAYHVLGCRHFARVDMMIDALDSPFILEVNTIPGLTEMSLFPKAARAAGIDFDQLCLRLVQLAVADLTAH